MTLLMTKHVFVAMPGPRSRMPPFQVIAILLYAEPMQGRLHRRIKAVAHLSLDRRARIGNRLGWSAAPGPCSCRAAADSCCSRKGCRAGWDLKNSRLVSPALLGTFLTLIMRKTRQAYARLAALRTSQSGDDSALIAASTPGAAPGLVCAIDCNLESGQPCCAQSCRCRALKGTTGQTWVGLTLQPA